MKGATHAKTHQTTQQEEQMLALDQTQEVRLSSGSEWRWQVAVGLRPGVEEEEVGLR